MSKMSLPAKRLLTIIAIITPILFAGGVVLCFALPALTTADILPISLGLLIFAILNVVKIFLLEYQVSKLTKMDDPNSARGFAIGHGLIRFVLTGGGLVLAAFLPFDNHYALFAAIIGAFSWNIAVYALRFMKIDIDPDLAPGTNPDAAAQKSTAAPDHSPPKSTTPGISPDPIEGTAPDDKNEKSEEK